MIEVTRPLSRLSCSAIHSGGKSRGIVIELQPPGNIIGFRLKGTRKTYYLPVDHCFREAMRAELARQKRERIEARKNRH